VGLALAVVRLANPWHNDAWGFWGMWRDGVLYDARWLELHAYVYSPALAHLLWPATLLPFPVFSAAWNMAQLLSLVAIAGPVWAVALIWLLPWPTIPGYDNAVLATLENGNPMLLLALAVVAGRRWPAAWAFVLLTKITPGIGLLWFAVRGEWRALALAVGATAAVAAVSLEIAPGLWVDWIELMATAAGTDTIPKEPILPVPLLVRLPVAALLVVWGARTDRYWSVPIAAMLALPAIQLGGFAVAVGAIPFLRLPLTPRWMRGA